MIDLPAYSVFIEGVTDGRQTIYRATHLRTGIVQQMTLPGERDYTREFPTIRADLMVRLAEQVERRTTK